jgi:hypothetical protein
MLSAHNHQRGTAPHCAAFAKAQYAAVWTLSGFDFGRGDVSLSELEAIAPAIFSVATSLVLSALCWVNFVTIPLQLALQAALLVGAVTLKYLTGISASILFGMGLFSGPSLQWSAHFVLTLLCILRFRDRDLLSKPVRIFSNTHKAMCANVVQGGAPLQRRDKLHFGLVWLGHALSFVCCLFALNSHTLSQVLTQVEVSCIRVASY